MRRGPVARALPWLALVVIALQVGAGGPPRGGALVVGPPASAEGAPGPPSEVVVHVSDLPSRSLSEFEVWRDAASPGGVLVGTPNHGDDLDPPPEDDPHVRFRVSVRRGVPYRCWIHMKVGQPKGVSLANRLYVQFTDAVDEGGREVLRPGTGSYLTAQGPTVPGWAWVGCEASSAGAPGPLIRFRTGGDITVRVQAGMEGTGFDQLVLSPARYLSSPPSARIVPRSSP